MSEKTKVVSSKKVKNKQTKINVIIVLSLIYLAIIASIIIVATRKSPTNLSVEKFIFDDFEVFSSEQEQRINENCKLVQGKYGLNVYVSTCERKKFNNSISKYDHYDFVDNYYATQDGSDFLREHNLSYSDNLAIIIINCQKRDSVTYDYHFDIYIFGHADKKISELESDKIIWSDFGDEILSSDPDRATDAVLGMTKDIGVAYAGILSYHWLVIIIVALLIGALISIITTTLIKKSYSKTRESNNYSFTANTNVNLTVRDDKFSHKNVTFVIRSSSSGGSGSHGGHSSGGGGGAGHRGGR